MTSDNNSLLALLAHLAWRFPGSNEDIATEALAFILNKEEGARSALGNLLQAGGGSLASIACVQTQRVYELSKRPDLVAFDEDERVLALIESKFWAGLTSHQPNGYLSLMLKDLPAAKVLLFLAPEARLESLWTELCSKAVEQEEFQVGDTHELEGVRSATVGGGSHRLALTSWSTLLGRIRESIPDADGELRQLIGLCARVENDRRIEPSGLEILIDDAVQRAKERRYVSTDGLAVGRWNGKYGRYFRFVGLEGKTLGVARLGLDFERSHPIFLSFADSYGGHMPEYMSSVRQLDRMEPDDNLPIALPADAGHQFAVEHVVARLKEVRDGLSAAE